MIPGIDKTAALTESICTPDFPHLASFLTPTVRSDAADSEKAASSEEALSQGSAGG